MEQEAISISETLYPLQTVTFVFSTLGIVLLSAALFLLILTAVLFKEWRHNYKNQLLLQFMVARFFYTTARYVLNLDRAFQIFEMSELLFNIQVFMWFYSGTAQLSWIYVFTRHMYACLTKVFNVKKCNIWKVSFLAWIIPVPVTVVLSATFQINPIEIRIYEFYLLIVKWPLLLIIAITLSLTLKSILLSNKSRPENNPRIIAVMVLLIFSFCGQEFIVDVLFVHILRSLRSDDVSRRLKTIVVVYNIVSLYHCSLTIVFWLFGNAQTRKLWRFEKPTTLPRGLVPQVSVVEPHKSEP